MKPALFVTFKVTEEGDEGHPMEHVLTVVQVGDDGEPTAESMVESDRRVRREIARKVALR